MNTYFNDDIVDKFDDILYVDDDNKLVIISTFSATRDIPEEMIEEAKFVLLQKDVGLFAIIKNGPGSTLAVSEAFCNSLDVNKLNIRFSDAGDLIERYLHVDPNSSDMSVLRLKGIA